MFAIKSKMEVFVRTALVAAILFNALADATVEVYKNGKLLAKRDVIPESLDKLLK